MNGEVLQIATLVANAKYALKHNTGISFECAKYINRIEFHFLPVKDLLMTEQVVATNVNDWYKELKNRQIEDLKLLIPTAVKDRKTLGFSNTNKSCILCFYKDGNLSYFTANWEYDSKLRAWNVFYKESVWENPPEGKLILKNNTKEFHEALVSIADFARLIDFAGFAITFEKAARVLEHKENEDESSFDMTNLLCIPESNISLFKAAYISDVFGAMGSWNDSPPCYAHEKGLDSEYESLSDKLLTNIRLAILYSINEW